MHLNRARLCAPSAALAPRAVMRKKPPRGTVHVSACPQKAKRATTARARGRCAAGRPLGDLLPSQTCTNAKSSDSCARKTEEAMRCLCVFLNVCAQARQRSATPDYEHVTDVRMCLKQSTCPCSI